MTIKLVHASDINAADIKKCWVANYIQELYLAEDNLVENVTADYYYLSWNHHAFPVIVVDQYYPEQSYVASLFNSYISYSIEELSIVSLPKWLKWISDKLIRTIGILFNKNRLDRVVYINNWLVSTNLYPHNFEPADVQELIREVSQKFPSHTICFRSLTEGLNAATISALTQAGFCRLASRQVYLFDTSQKNLPTILKHKDIKQDMKLLSKLGSYSRINDTPSPAMLRKYQWMYKKLYLEKYCDLNPKYSVEWLKVTADQKIIIYNTLYNQHNEVTGINGIFQVDNVMSVPVFGYDCDSDPKLAYYRQLTITSIQRSIDQSLLFHASSGVADFKINRGGIAYIEYSLCYVKHLPFSYRWQIGCLSLIVNNIGIRVMQAFKL